MHYDINKAKHGYKTIRHGKWKIQIVEKTEMERLEME